MVKYDFDRQIERRGTGALKTDALEARYGKADLLPLWVADMDFETLSLSRPCASVWSIPYSATR